jgi:hypothetical protein
MPGPSVRLPSSCVLATSAPGSTSTPRTFLDRALALILGDSVVEDVDASVEVLI